MGVFQRTVRISLHYATTRIKQKKLDKVTARWTSAVSLFLDLICESNVSTKKELSVFEQDVQASTSLSAGFVQQCRDKAVWMYKSYKEIHKDWERKVTKCKDGRYLKKLKRREPGFPAVKNKVPVRLDSRTANLITKELLEGAIVKDMKKELKLTVFWLNLSTLIKGSRMMLPLKLSKYHLERLHSCTKIVDCEILKKKKKYYMHFVCEYEVPDSDIQYLKAVDLGIIRNMSTVLINCEGKLVKNSFKIFNDNKMKNQLNVLDKKTKQLQYQKKWTVLKKIRERRKNFVEYFMRKSAKKFAKNSQNCTIIIGHPKEIKYKHYKGNGNKKHRKRLHKWSYAKQIIYIQQACQKKGLKPHTVNEANTSKQCNNCKSYNTQRPYKNNFSLFHCNNCNKTYNSDFNAVINVGKRTITSQSPVMAGRFLNQQEPKRMTAPQYADDPTQKWVSA